MKFNEFAMLLSSCYKEWTARDDLAKHADAYMCIICNNPYTIQSREELEVVNKMEIFGYSPRETHNANFDNRASLSEGIEQLELVFATSFWRIANSCEGEDLTAERMNLFRVQFLKRVALSFATGEEFVKFAANCDTIESFQAWFYKQ